MSYLLFARSVAELSRVRREVSEYFAFRSREPVPVSTELHGVWIEPDSLSQVPEILIPPSWQASERGFRIPESLGVSGVWQLARLHAPTGVSPDQELPDRLIESLHGLAGGPTGLFAPVFTGGASRAVMREELLRLRQRYPGGLAAPWVQDPQTGALESLNDLEF